MNAIAAVLARFKFRLATLFALVSVVALGLTLAQRWMHVPMRSGTIYHAICYATDWEKLAKSLPSRKHGDFVLHTFDAAEAQDVFRAFSPTPQIRFIDKIPEAVGRQSPNQPSFLSSACFWSRPVDCPVGGFDKRIDFDSEVMDQLAISGAFQESVIPPQRYHIDCTVVLQIGIQRGVERPKLHKSRLHYDGTAQDRFMVFARPIDSVLVELLIIDMRPGGTGE